MEMPRDGVDNDLHVERPLASGATLVAHQAIFGAAMGLLGLTMSTHRDLCRSPRTSWSSANSSEDWLARIRLRSQRCATARLFRYHLPGAWSLTIRPDSIHRPQRGNPRHGPGLGCPTGLCENRGSEAPLITASCVVAAARGARAAEAWPAPRRRSQVARSSAGAPLR
jgi:hypothetical protein